MSHQSKKSRKGAGTMKRNTRQDIVDTFMRMVESSSLSKVRIADLIASLGINRNTFYYHFTNKQDVAIWILRTDLDRELRASFPADELVYSPCFDKESDERELAYYVHVETGARTLDASGFTRALARCTLARAGFYRKVFNAQEMDFTRCFGALYYPAIERDIDFILDGRYLPPATRRMLAQLCCRYLVSVTRFCLEDTEGSSLLDDRVNPFWNIVHESLYTAIQTHPVNRYARKAGE